MNQRALLSLLVIILLALASTWISRERAPARPDESPAQAHIANYFIHQFSAVTMDEQGQPKHQLEADTLIHYADDDSSEMQQPRLKVYRPNDEYWQVRSERGAASAQAKELRLFDNVLIERPDVKGIAGMRIETQSMLLRPDAHYAETAAPVTITEAGSRIDAIGMRAYLAKERVELLSSVRGVYVPQ